MRPEDALRAIDEVREDAIVAPTMTTVPAWRTIAPDAPSVACVGFMGGASSLGLALAQPERRVIVLDGDGSLLMQLGSLATVAGAAPPNYTHLLFANGVYQTSGSQAIPARGGIDFAGMAAAAGYANTTRIETLEEFRIRLPELLAATGPVFAELATVEAELTPMTAPGGEPLRVQVAQLRERLARGKP